MNLLEKRIQDELSRMDGGLFLDKEADRYGRIFYSIKHTVASGGSVSLYTALEWTYPDGAPRPLSDDLLSLLRAQEGDIHEAAKQAMVNNLARKELLRQAAHKEADEVAEDWDSHKRGSKFISTGTGGMDHKTLLNKRERI